MELELRFRTSCEDTLCIAKKAVEAVLEKIGVEADNAEKYAKELAELMGGSKTLYDQYVFTVGI